MIRRSFLYQSSVATLAMFGISQLGSQHQAGMISSPEDPDSDLPFGFPSQDRDSVLEVVSAAHGRFDRVQELVSARPDLAKATWDWGFGDWESAIGAASHMGRVDIANFLMEHGARPNLFTYVMLGKVDAVQSIIESVPGIQRIHGPHGITLLRHAKIRLGVDGLTEREKSEMQQMVDYLESVEGADEGQFNMTMSEEETKGYLGDYKFGSENDEYFKIDLNRRGQLYMSRGEQIGRTLLKVEEHGFAPSGAPGVRVRFDWKDEQAISLTVHDPIPLVKATRI